MENEGRRSHKRGTSEMCEGLDPSHILLTLRNSGKLCPQLPLGYFLTSLGVNPCLPVCAARLFRGPVQPLTISATMLGALATLTVNPLPVVAVCTHHAACLAWSSMKHSTTSPLGTQCPALPPGEIFTWACAQQG